MAAAVAAGVAEVVVGTSIGRLFFAIAGATASTGGLILTIALKSSMSATGLEGMMVFFTLFGTLLNTIGLIKSIRDYYDVGKYLSIAGFALLGIMWIIGLS